MNDENQASAQADSAVSTRTVEVIVAAFFLVLGALVMWDSARIGAGWGIDGPETGCFPFFVSLFMVLATCANLISVFRTKSGQSFVSKVELRPVLAIFFPCLVYLAVMQFLGIYVASAIFIIGFMRWQGKYSYLKASVCGIGVVVVLFLMFEVFFKVPLIKGPLEAMLGY